jgi:hypothetical protein
LLGQLTYFYSFEHSARQVMEGVLSPNKISGSAAIAKIKQQDRPRTAELDEIVTWMAAEIERTGYLDHNATAQ